MTDMFYPGGSRRLGRRLGLIDISEHFIACRPEEVMDAMGHVIPLDIYVDFVNGRIQYTCWCPQFRELEDGAAGVRDMTENWHYTIKLESGTCKGTLCGPGLDTVQDAREHLAWQYGEKAAKTAQIRRAGDDDGSAVSWHKSLDER